MQALAARFGALITALALAASGCGAPSDLASEVRIDLDFEHYRLDNGLEVILRRDDRLPIASVNIWYHVGPANEVEGSRGLAHLFEHIMLQGSGHAPGDYFSRLEAVGATGVNGNTDLDRTAFLEDVPSDRLELALWAEADRMGFLMDAVDLATLRGQQSVIRNERRQRLDNAPYGLGAERVYQLLFPEDHPYHHYIFGSHLEMQSAELDDLRDFFERYYTPNNASLSIVGNIDVGRTKEWIDKYFGPLPPGPEVAEPDIEAPQLAHERRAVVTDDVELPRAYLAWVSPKAFSGGDAQAILAARMLGGGKASRLYRDLVHDLQIAQSVEASQRSLSHGSVFRIVATARPGHSAQELEDAIDRSIRTMAAEGPSEQELVATKAATLAVTVKSLEPTDAVADRLNAYNHFLGDPGFLEQDLRRFQEVTTGQVREFVGETLRPEARAVVHVNPGPREAVEDPPAPEAPTPGPAPASSTEPWRLQVPGPTAAPPSDLPVPESFRLENGLQVHLVQRPELPLFTAQVTVRAPVATEPPGIGGFTADMLNEGAGERDALDIANGVTALGSTLTTGSSREASWVIAQGLTPNLHATMQIMRDVVLEPTFPEDGISRVRRSRLAALQAQRSQPGTTAFRVMWREHYGADHPYGYLGLGTERSLRTLTREQLLESYEDTFDPASAALILAGDLTTDQARSVAERYFGDWASRGTRSGGSAEPAASPERVVMVDRADSSQTRLVLSQAGIRRTDPDFDRLLLVNAVLGDLFGSRLNLRLREELGYTYGVDSSLTQSTEPGLLYVTLSVDARHTGEAIREVLAGIERLRAGGMAEQEMEDARESIVRSLPRSFRTNGSIAGRIAHAYALDLPQDYFRQLPERLSAVALDEINALARTFLDPASMKVVAVGDRGAIEAQLADLGLGPVDIRTADADRVAEG